MRAIAPTLALGERIAWYRHRRGMTQEVLAGLVGRTTDWLSKVENGHIELDRLSVLRRLAQALDITVGDLVAEPSLLRDSDPGKEPEALAALRSVLMDYRPTAALDGESGRSKPPDSTALKQQVADVWTAYQESRFGYTIHRLADLIPKCRAAVHSTSVSESQLSSGRLALAYQAAATTLTKLGEPDLAWKAADRGFMAAQASDNPVILGALIRTVIHALHATGAFPEAVRLTFDAEDFFQAHLAKPSKSMLSVYGAQLLAGSMAAARNHDRETTRDLMKAATWAASRLGADDNRLWTAFGPTNVAIHRVSTAMELGDVQIALDIGPCLNTAALPTERRVRHGLEVARALTIATKRDDAVAAVLDAEQLAPEQVRYHFLSRHLVETWIRTQRGRPSTDLANLARRLDVQ